MLLHLSVSLFKGGGRERVPLAQPPPPPLPVAIQSDVIFSDRLHGII